MTNRKIKDYHRNRIAYEITYENYKNLCRIMLTLHKLYPKKFYAKKILEWLNEYAETCADMNRYDAAGAYEYKMQELCEEYEIDGQAALEFVVKNNKNVYNRKNLILLAENVKLALVQTCAEFGIGKKRLDEIQAALADSDIQDPLEDMKSIGLEVDVSDMKITDIDYRELRPKKEKEMTQAEIKAAYRDLEGLKAYQEEMLGAERI